MSVRPSHGIVDLMKEHQHAVLALQLQRATRRFQSIRHLALASTSREAISSGCQTVKPDMFPEGRAVVGLMLAISQGLAFRAA